MAAGRALLGAWRRRSGSGVLAERVLRMAYGGSIALISLGRNAEGLIRPLSEPLSATNQFCLFPAAETPRERQRKPLRLRPSTPAAQHDARCNPLLARFGLLSNSWPRFSVMPKSGTKENLGKSRFGICVRSGIMEYTIS